MFSLWVQLYVPRKGHCDSYLGKVRSYPKLKFDLCYELKITNSKKIINCGLKICPFSYLVGF